MMQDVEFGILQIVDIALKAVSPAVNDPTTALTCIDQLGSILLRCAFGSLQPDCFEMARISPGSFCGARRFHGCSRSLSARSDTTEKQMSLFRCV